MIKILIVIRSMLKDMDIKFNSIRKTIVRNNKTFRAGGIEIYSLT